jgi:hypothetical protein
MLSHHLEISMSGYSHRLKLTLLTLGTRQTPATMLVLMHPTNPTFLAPNLFPPMASRYLVLPRGISITPRHLRTNQSHLWYNAKKTTAG